MVAGTRMGGCLARNSVQLSGVSFQPQATAVVKRVLFRKGLRSLDVRLKADC